MDVDGISAGHRPDGASDVPDPYWGAGPAEAAMAAVAAAVDGLLEVDLTAPGTGATLDLLRAVEVQSRRLYGMSVAVISEMDHRGLAAPAGQLSTSGLVRQVINISRGDAAARVRLSAATCVGVGMSGGLIPARLPLLAAAVHAGSVGPRHADLVGSVFKSFDATVPEELRESVEAFLVAEAATADPLTFQNVCQSIILAANPDGPAEEKDAHDKQEFHIGARRPNGLTKVWGLLDDLTVESLRVIFGAMCAPSADRNKCDAPEPEPTSTRTGDTAGDTASEPAPPVDATDGDEATACPVVAEVDLDDPDPTRPTADAPNGEQTTGGPPTPPDLFSPDDPGEPGHPGEPGGGGEADELRGPGEAGESYDAGAPENDSVATDVDPPPTWRAPRFPYEWAPLGTLPADYPHPTPPRGDDPYPDPALTPPPAGGGDPCPDPESGLDMDLRPRLFGDDDPHPDPDADPGRQTDPTGKPRAATRRAQALGIVLTTFLETGHAPQQSGEKPQLLITVQERSLRDRLGHGTLGYGTHISIKQVRMLACDSKIIAAVLGGRSELLDMGRSMRAFNAATARAILLRDKGCVFPGCDMPGLWTEKHHIQPWEDGGPSNYTNGCLLCRRHHTLIHHSDWQIHMAPDGHPEIIPPATHDPTRTPIRNTLNHPPAFNWPQPARI